MSVLAIPTPTTVNGLPFHPLIVHAVVVILPLAVLGAIGISLWPAMRRHLGLLVLLAGVIGLILVPIATSSGEKFRDQLGVQQLVRTHQHYAEKLLPYTAVLVVLLLLTMIVDLARRLGPVMAAAPLSAVAPVEAAGGGGVAVATRPVAAPTTSTTRLDRSLGRVIPVGLRSSNGLLRVAQPILSVLTIASALVLVWYVYKTGDSGAKAVWGGR
ncbi:MAG: hypothetical protein JWN96_64 [Mycobacterium sp.]|nr:hypothetical protein [Mycobacterium sp.]